MELIFDDKTGTWGEAPEVYGTIKCPTKEDYEYALNAIKSHKQLEDKHWDECRQIAHYDNELSKYQKEMPKIVEYIDYLRSLPVNRWISVEDKLPIEQGPVLCYARSTTGEGNYRILGTLRNGEFWFLQVDGTQLSFPCLHLKVTHWMPLPEPPKDGGAEDETL